MTGIVDDILEITDDILGIRDDLGAEKHSVFIFTRTWSGSRLGEGTKTDSQTQILPTPALIDHSHNLRLKEGGRIRQGDIMVKYISKQSFPDESVFDNSTSGKNIEKYILINNRLYTVINIVEEHVYWNIQVRKTSKKL